jgi:hypothetical protein
MKLKEKLFWFYIDVMLLLRIYKTCHCGDIYPRWQFINKECEICSWINETIVEMDKEIIDDVKKEENGIYEDI